VKVVHLDTGRDWRGGQAQALLLMRGLARRGHSSLLLAPRGPLLDRARAAGIAVEPWRPLGELDPVAVLRAARAIRRARADIVHCHGAHAHAVGVPAARLGGARAVVVSRRVDFAVGGNLPSRLKYRLPVDRYLCISRGVADVMLAGGIPAGRIALVPSGVELPAEGDPRPSGGAGRADLRELIGASPGTPVIGTVAALAPHKNHADLARAAAIVARTVPDARFAWVGDGECRADLERQLRELRLERHVRLTGFRSDALDLLSQFTIFVLASYLEGLCTSLLDAQVLGVPIVATAVGGVPDVVEEGRTGWLVPGRDPDSLARAILDALAHPAEARRRADAARVSVRAFSADAMVERTLREYDSVLHERAGE
jgi:glycosyltransferase involved in cell wall biosynthesis